jgi:hypothetical protein
VYELAMAMIGLPKSSSVVPVARHSERAGAAWGPLVVVSDRSGLMGGTFILGLKIQSLD